MKNLIRETYNLTDIQAEVLLEIARHGFMTVNVLEILTYNYSDTYAYRVIKRLEKLKLVRLKKASIIPGSKFIIYPKQKVKDLLKQKGYIVPAAPKSAIQYRHNLIAIAVILIEKQLKNADGYLTTNQVNKFKDEGKWRSRKTPDGIIIKNKKGYLIEVELHVKAYRKYQDAFAAIEIEDNISVLKRGWINNIYYVDSRKAEKKMNKIINWLKKFREEVSEVAEKTVVVYLQDLLDEFNERFSSNIKLEIFHPVI